MTRHRNELISNRYWVDAMSGTQLDSVGSTSKTLRCISEFETVLKSVVVEDIHMLVEALNFNEDNMTTCVAITSPNPPNQLKK